MSNRPDVQYAEPNHLWFPDDVFPTDPEFDRLWGLHNTGQEVGYVPSGYSGPSGTPDADIDAPEGWDDATATDGIVVAVIDTGIDIAHEDLTDQIWVNNAEASGTPGVDDDGNGYVDDVHGYDFHNGDGSVFDAHQPDDHGTHVAGTIAASWDNGVGVAGVSNAQIMSLKFLGPGGGTTSDAVLAIDYAIDNGAHVTNNSWGGGGFSQALKDKIDEAAAADQLFVAAAGNSGVDNDSTPHYPSSYTSSNVLSVAATDHDDALASFSNYGATSVDMGAPGTNLYSTVPQFGKIVLADPSAAGYHAAHHAFTLAGVLDSTGHRQDVVEADLAYAGVTPVGADIVVVDDDGGAAFEDPWLTSLGALGATVSTCAPSYAGTTESRCGHADHLDNFDLVVWTTGAEFSDTLNSTDRSQLTDYLQSRGGRLVLEGTDLGCDLSGDPLCHGTGSTISPVPFFNDVMKSRYVADADANLRPQGVSGTAFAGLSLELEPGTAGTGQTWADALATAAGGTYGMRARSTPGSTARRWRPRT